MKRIAVTASSQTGTVRSNNEDMILVAEWFVRDDSCTTGIDIDETSRIILAVSDGMGGCNAGEVASELVLENLHFFIGDLPAGLSSDGLETLMKGWLDSMNKIIDSKGHVDARLSNMGTTLVAILCYEGRFFCLNCGDSRLYRMRDGELQRMTTDHSLNTLIGEERHSNVLTNCIGAGCRTSYIDFVPMSPDVRAGDVYVLCSDGLSDMLSDSEISALLSRGATAGVLCDAAIEAGGYDNVSVCVAVII